MMAIAVGCGMTLALPMGFLFTNAVGEVVFTDRGFLRLTKRRLDRPPIGQPLHDTLGIEEQFASHFLRDLTHRGSADRPALSVRTTTGSLRATYAVGVAVFTGRQSYIGADIQLSPPLPRMEALVRPQSHTDVLDNYSRSSLEEVRLLKTGTFVQVYMTVHIDALQVLLARLGGLDMRSTLERLLDSTAIRNGIPATMRDGYLEFGDRTVPFGAYQRLFQTAIDYAVDAIGRRLVHEEMKAIDQRIDPGVLQAARLLGLTVGGDE
jgi:hypothetical protein